jgi:predicted RNA binding protein YcfA (HicA-like mRNA interferase family)
VSVSHFSKTGATIPGERMKYREVIRLIERDGWKLVAQRGSHRQYEHPVKPGKVTVAGKPGLDVPRGTAANILRQAGLRGTE